MNFWGTFRIIVGTLAGGALGFKVMHIAEENYKEKIRADIANLPEEKVCAQNEQEPDGARL